MRHTYVELGGLLGDGCITAAITLENGSQLRTVRGGVVVLESNVSGALIDSESKLADPARLVVLKPYFFKVHDTWFTQAVDL